ncbi:unnamed protein product [Peniophora sp. CBMAI 1063]|nr:unnamed protein product [Peniophora sp. CBMAI 1063]
MIYLRTSANELERSGGSEKGDSPSDLSASSSSFTLPSKTSSPRAGTWKTHVIMIGVLLTASATCIGHHLFLSVLDRRDIDDFAISQTWVRDIGNALAGLVQMLLQVSVGIALTQSIWLYIRRNDVTLNNLDVLFSLPSYSVLPSTLFTSSVLYVLFLAGIIQTLSLVGIFAPNALSVASADPIEISLRVPDPSLDRIAATASSYFFLEYIGANSTDHSQDSLRFIYMNPSASFQRLARSVLDGGNILSWAPPQGCGRSCSYDIAFGGPVLRCTDIPQSSIGVLDVNLTNAITPSSDPIMHPVDSDPSHFLGTAYVYNATSTFLNDTSLAGNAYYAALEPPLHDTKALTVDVVYATDEFSLPVDPEYPLIYHNTTGFSCGFFNATYAASVSYMNGSQTTSVRVVQYGAPLETLSQSDVLAGKNASDINGASPELLTTYASLSLVGAMSQYLYGTLSFDFDSTSSFLLVPTYTSVLSSVFTTQASFEKDNGGSSNTLALSLASTSYDNLGRQLEDACTNLTASLMSDTANLGLYTEVQALVTPDFNMYRYKASRLWLVYGIALMCALLANLYGAFCIVRNGRALQRTFSSIAAAVRNRDLDALLNDTGEPLSVHADRVWLRYRAGGFTQSKPAGFAIAGSSKDEENKEMSETVALTDELEARF